jgi:hypothetical protein
MKQKMSKSKSNRPNLSETPIEVKLAGVESELKYWKLRYELLEKYGK